MAELFDYIAWRGDLPLYAVPLCDVDALVFARLSYVPFEEIVPAGFDAAVPLKDAAEQVLREGRLEKRQGLAKEDTRLLELLRDAPRYQNLPLCGYESILDPAQEEQFAALTLRLPLGACVAYRGTDGTLVGWKEDFNMAFADVVPAQRRAVEYLERAAGLPGTLRLCGHSKGGNLAVYAAAFCGDNIQSRIVSVRNFDGPGFDRQITERADFQRIMGRTRTYLPKASVIGMLLEHEEQFTVVDSRGTGIYQHNVYLWEVRRSGFCELQQLNGSSQLIDRTLKDWLAGMSRQEREQVINGVYAALQATDASTVREVRERGKMAALRAVLAQDEETRRLTLSALRIFYQSLKRSLPESPLRDLEERLPFLKGISDLIIK